MAIEKVQEELHEIKHELKTMNITLARNTASLEIHIKRTEANEARINRIEGWTVGLLVSILAALLGIIGKSFL